MAHKKTETNNLTDITQRRKSNGIRNAHLTEHSTRHKYFNPWQREGKTDICRSSADTSKIHKLWFRGLNVKVERGRFLEVIFFYSCRSWARLEGTIREIKL